MLPDLLPDVRPSIRDIKEQLKLQIFVLACDACVVWDTERGRHRHRHRANMRVFDASVWVSVCTRRIRK